MGLIRLGDVFQMKCGTNVKVVAIINSYYLTVVGPEGIEKKMKRNDLINKRYEWLPYGKALKDMIGKQFKLNCGVVVTVLPSFSGTEVLVEDDEGNKKTTIKSSLIAGNVSWTEFGISRYNRTTSDIQVGCRWQTKKWGWLTITEYHSAGNLTVKWDESGNVQKHCDAHGVRAGTLRDKARHWNYLKADLSKHYVYIVKYKGEIVYVGQGFHNRYLHTDGGTSHCLELNRLFFLGEKVVTSLYKQGLSKEESLDIERKLILEYNPKFNIKEKPALI